MMIKLPLNGVEMTRKLGEMLASVIKVNSVITLSGDLGAGKTSFAQGFARGLGIKEVITSPTFNLVKSYKLDKMMLHHIDAYRLEGVKQNLGFDEYFESNSICLVEWPEYIFQMLPKKHLKIVINKIDDNNREAVLSNIGEEYQNIVGEIQKLWNII